MTPKEIRPASVMRSEPTIDRMVSPMMPCERAVRKSEIVGVIARDDGSSLIVESTHYGCRIAFAQGRQRPAFVAIRANEIGELIRGLNRCTTPSRRRRFI